MRRIKTVYAAVSIWFFGWFTATFGFLPALFITTIFASPCFFLWRMTTPNRAIKRREYFYLAILTTLAVAGSLFIVMKWFETGMDRLAFFDREYDAFCHQIATMPEYRNVEISYTNRKGGRVYLHGSVGTKYAHDQLIQIIDNMIRNNDSGYYDGIAYPGKPSSDDQFPVVSEHIEGAQKDTIKPQ
jgi:hypothetical protein